MDNQLQAVVAADDSQARQAVLDACRQLVQWGYFIGTYGNVSVRVPGGLLITPTRVDYAALQPEDMVTIAGDGRPLINRHLPSSETEVHKRIYARRPDVSAVVHTHSLYATAQSCRHVNIPVIVEEQSQVIGGPIRCTRYVPAGQHAALGAEVAELLAESQAVLLANHGVVCCGPDMEAALLAAQVVERVCQMQFLIGSDAVPIPAVHVDAERHRFLFKYGRLEDRAGEADVP